MIYASVSVNVSATTEYPDRTKDAEDAEDAGSDASYIPRCVKSFIMQDVSDFSRGWTNLARVKRYPNLEISVSLASANYGQ